MSEDTKTAVSLSILGKEYLVGCTAEEREDLALSADYLNKDMLIGLAIVNPVYFFCMMIGAMKNFSISIAVIGGTILGPLIYLISTEWALLFAGLTAGTVAFLFGDSNGK